MVRRNDRKICNNEQDEEFLRRHQERNKNKSILQNLFFHFNPNIWS